MLMFCTSKGDSFTGASAGKIDPTKYVANVNKRFVILFNYWCNSKIMLTPNACLSFAIISYFVKPSIPFSDKKRGIHRADRLQLLGLVVDEEERRILGVMRRSASGSRLEAMVTGKMPPRTRDRMSAKLVATQASRLHLPSVIRSLVARLR